MDHSLHYTSVNHPTLLTESVNRLRINQELCDVTLLIGDRRILGHCVILSACMPFFHIRLDKIKSKFAMKELRLPGDLDPSAVDSVIEFCYTSTISINEDNIWPVMNVAGMFKLPEVQNVCSEFVTSQIHKDNCLQIWKSSLRYQCDIVHKKCQQFIVDNLKLIVFQESFQSLGYDDLVSLLVTIRSHGTPTKDVCEALHIWLSRDLKRRSFLQQVVTQFPDLKDEFRSYLPYYDDRTISTDTSAAPVSMETFECPVCRVLLPSKNELTTHVSQHSDSVHMCVTCHQLFNSKEELKLHSVVHTREMSEKSKAMDPTPSPDKGTIPRLNHSFGGFDHSDRNFLGSDFQNASGNSTSKSDDDVEAYVMKQSPNAYACGFCSKSYSNRCNLKAHIRTHKGKQPFACTYCGKEFSSKCVLTVHVRSHTGEKPFPCEICGVSFSKQVHRNRHKSTHSGIKPFPCEICGKQFTRNDHVKRHIQNVHKDTKPYECVNCGVEFITSKEFSEHLEKHSRENDLFPTNSANISNFLKDGFDSRLQTPSNIQANIPLKDKTFTILP